MCSERVADDRDSRSSSPPAPDPSWAYFLDFDGTLVDIAPTPSDVRVAPDLIPVLTAVERVTGGAVMVVSGRPMAEIDAFLTPLRLPVAAQHGGERRFADGRVEGLATDPALRAAAERIQRYCAAHPGTLTEEKGASVTLHYRQAPELADDAVALMTVLAEEAGPDYRLLHGKMVLELKPAGIDKGKAIDVFRSGEPFAGRRPVMIGDDKTDEDGFRAVNAAHGVSIRVGKDLAGSQARYRLDSPQAVRAWLSSLVAGSAAAGSLAAESLADGLSD